MQAANDTSTASDRRDSTGSDDSQGNRGSPTPRVQHQKPAGDLTRPYISAPMPAERKPDYHGMDAYSLA